MLTAEDVRFLDGWRKRGNNISRRVDLLHCTSAYPAPLEDMNLQVVAQAWCDGLSDHSRDPRVAALAVQLGARVLEAHLRLDSCSPDNPDYSTALTPKEFETFVLATEGDDWACCEEHPYHLTDELRALMLGDGVKRPMPSEAAMSQYRVR
jgi:sialic acid synthase SpsE